MCWRRWLAGRTATTASDSRFWWWSRSEGHGGVIGDLGRMEQERRDRHVRIGLLGLFFFSYVCTYVEGAHKEGRCFSRPSAEERERERDDQYKDSRPCRPRRRARGFVSLRSCLFWWRVALSLSGSTWVSSEAVVALDRRRRDPHVRPLLLLQGVVESKRRALPKPPLRVH